MPYTHHPNTNIENHMKIEHITYDAAHKIRAKRPTTAAEKIRNFFQKDSHKDYVEGDIKAARYDFASTTKSTARIAREDSSPKRQSEQKSRKTAKRQEKELRATTHVPLYEWTPSRPAASGESGYQVLGDDKIHKITKSDIRPVMSKFHIPTTTLAKPDSRGAYHGRLEHSPNKSLDLEPRQYSPLARPSPNSISKSTPKSTAKPTPKESRSVFTPLNNSADLLDAKRRELKSALHKSTERIRSSAHLSLKQRQAQINDSDSDESFFCSGDPSSTANSKDRLPTHAQLPSLRTNPWVARNDCENSCRLCHVREPARISGICTQCEKTYCSPQSDVFDDCYEIKPTPPLKMQRRAVCQGQDMRQSTQATSEIPPMPPLKGNELKMLKVHNVDVAKPILVSVPLKHQPSHRVVMGRLEPVRKKTISKSARWPTGGVRGAYRSAENVQQWSEEDGSNSYPVSSSPNRSSSRYSSDGDELSLLTGQKTKKSIRRKEKTVKKTDSFYAFYETLLRDHGTKTPNSWKSAKRFNDL